MSDERGDEIKTWPHPISPVHDIRQPITEGWLRTNYFRIEDGRNDSRFPIRSLAIGGDILGGKPFMGSTDDLCIDVAPRIDADQRDWHVWISQREPYRFLHVRFMRETWEIIRLYEGLTGRVWPGTWGGED